MSDQLAVNKVKANEVGAGSAVTPDFATEEIHIEISDKSINNQLLDITCVQRCEDNAVTGSPLSGHQGDSFLHATSLVGTERPKAGLTRTKRNLKKQLFLKKAAALDEGRQTPNQPSLNHCCEDGNIGANCSLTSTTITSVALIDSPVIQTGGSGIVITDVRICSNEEQNASVTVKTEAIDNDDFAYSSASFSSSVALLHADRTTDKMTASEHLCPSPNETISQSGTEVAGPTKWIIGDMLWARVSGHPWWPCMVAYDPTHTAFTRTLKRRQGALVQYHVQFFGDEGERGWINESSIIPYEGVEAFNKFCNEMKVLHKKERQNYTVPPRRAKAWNIAVKSSEEAYPMTRVFRVHRFAFVYDQPPAVANGSLIVTGNYYNSGQQGTKGVKRSRSSSVGGSGDGRPKKRQRMSGEKNMTSPNSMVSQQCCLSPSNRVTGQTSQEFSFSYEGSSLEIGSTVFRSRAEGVKRSSRFVKPTNRIMEHMEEVQQRRRIKLRPHSKVTLCDSNTGADQATETLLDNPKADELILTPTEELSTEMPQRQVNEAVDSDWRDEIMEISLAEAAEHSQKINAPSNTTLERMVKSTSFNMIYVQEKMAAVVSLTKTIKSAITESHDALDAVIKVEVDETILKSQSNSLSVTNKFELQKPALSSLFENKSEDEIGLSQEVQAAVPNNQDKVLQEMQLRCQEVPVLESCLNNIEKRQEAQSSHEQNADNDTKVNNDAECEQTELCPVDTAVGLEAQTEPLTDGEQKRQKKKNLRRTGI